MNTHLMKFQAKLALEKGIIDQQQYLEILAQIEKRERQRIIIDDNVIKSVSKQILSTYVHS